MEVAHLKKSIELLEKYADATIVDGMKVIENYDGETCITILNCNGKYEIYNIEDHEYIIDDADSVVNCDCGYITATFFGKRKYYTYKGMQINGLE